jgi:hypothetical protein
VCVCLIVYDLKISKSGGLGPSEGVAPQKINTYNNWVLNIPTSLHRKFAAVTHLSERGLSVI